MATLFPDVARSRNEPKRQGEKLFDFYNQCIRPGYDEFRSFVNGWIAQLPAPDQAEILSSMSRGGDQQFQAGLIELLVHAFLHGSNQKVLVHPTIEGSTKHPDFAVIDCDDRVLAYVEVTTINPADVVDAEANREAPIYNAIDRLKLPLGCVFGYDVIRTGTSSPPLAPLTRDIEAWVKESNAENTERKITRRFIAGDWELELDLFSGGSIQHDRAIGMASGGVGWIAPHLDLRGALELKAKRYGSLQASYLIVVADAKGQLFGTESAKDAITEAVLGDEVVQLRDGESPKLDHARNGFWHGPKGPRNTHVGGVLFFPDVGIWGLRSDELQPVLALNPWAKSPLPEFLKVLGRFESENEKWNFKEGKNFADILGLPTPWPPSQKQIAMT
jgi:hypothetical protein